MVLTDIAQGQLSHEGFRSYLLELEVASDVLRRDPSGRTWLEPEMFSLTQAKPDFRAILEEFVEEELELFSSVREAGDPLFTRRVLEATAPAEVAGSGLDPRWRGPLMTAAYAAGLLLTLLVLVPLVRSWFRGEGLFTALRQMTQ